MRRWLGIGGVVGGVVGFVTLLASGCSNTVAPFPDVGSFCTSLAAAQCEGSGDAGVTIASLCGVTAPDCEAAAQQACLSNANKALMETGREYTQANAQACIDATQTAYSSPAISATTLITVTSTCDAVFAGSVMVGGSCTSTGSCAQTASEAGAPPNVVCSPVAPGSKQMQCAMAVAVNQGGFCANPGSVCALGTYCNGVPAKCETGGTVGANCTPIVGCSSGAFCNIKAGAKTGSCIEGGQVGSSCTTDANCGTGAPYCDANVGNGSCEVGLSFAVGADDCKAFGATK